MPSGSPERAARVRAFMKEGYAAFWRDKVKVYGRTPYHERLIELVAGHTPPGAAVLEVGIGTGWPLAEGLKARGLRVIGVDLAPLTLRDAAQVVGRGNVVLGAVEELPFASDAFATVYCLQSLWLFPEPLAAIAELVRVTRPGGTLVFDVMNRASPRIQWKWAVPRLALLARNLVRLPFGRAWVPARFYHETPVTPWAVARTLARLGATWRVLALPDLEAAPRGAGWLAYRLVYVVSRGTQP